MSLEAGVYAIVRCHGEDGYRALMTNPARLGEAAGHAGLANEQPVIFAGELEIDKLVTLPHGRQSLALINFLMIWPTNR